MADKSVVESKLTQLFEDIFDVDKEKLSKLDICQENIEDWDSIGHVRLISALENEFKTEIPIDIAIEFKNFDMIAEYLSNSL